MSKDEPLDNLDLVKTAKSLHEGQRIFDRFVLKKFLGRGGMGVVWLARDEQLDRQVALKFLPDAMTCDQLAIEDLKRETRKSLELTHPNIVRVYDFIQSEDLACISMEYIEGKTLTKLRFEREPPVFNPGELLPLIKQCCEALAYAHAKAKIVHRDLKPTNLMVTDSGELKVMDFGIARSLSDSMTRVTAHKGTSGTLVYMSPQQLTGMPSKPTDDIYALAATIYELITGKPPFYTGEVGRQVLEAVAPPLAQRRTELEMSGTPIPPEWEATIAACLAKEAERRPQSALEIAERLCGQSKTASSNTEYLPPTEVVSGYAPQPGQKRSKMIAVVAIVIVIGIVGWWSLRPGAKQQAVLSSTSAAGSQSAPPDSPSPPSKSETVVTDAKSESVASESPVVRAAPQSPRQTAAVAPTSPGEAPERRTASAVAPVSAPSGRAETKPRQAKEEVKTLPTTSAPATVPAEVTEALSSFQATVGELLKYAETGFKEIRIMRGFRAIFGSDSHYETSIKLGVDPAIWPDNKAGTIAYRCNLTEPGVSRDRKTINVTEAAVVFDQYAGAIRTALGPGWQEKEAEGATKLNRTLQFTHPEKRTKVELQLETWEHKPSEGEIHFKLEGPKK